MHRRRGPRFFPFASFPLAILPAAISPPMPPAVPSWPPSMRPALVETAVAGAPGAQFAGKRVGGAGRALLTFERKENLAPDRVSRTSPELGRQFNLFLFFRLFSAGNTLVLLSHQDTSTGFLSSVFRRRSHFVFALLQKIDTPNLMREKITALTSTEVC